MTSRQYSFSFAVGVLFMAIGGVILTKATVGLSLIALGAAIASLAVVTRTLHGRSDAAVSEPASIHQMQGSATDY